LTLFEAGGHVDGHTVTTRADDGGRDHWVDAGSFYSCCSATSRSRSGS
jgi:predicted NAD/FAD-binding protein